MRLFEKYRPTTLSEVVGQPLVQLLQHLAANPYSCCILLECEHGGIGKTSAALAFASDIGCVDEFSGLHIVPCSEFTVDRARELFDSSLHLRPMQGNGWHVLVLEEFDWLPAQTQRFLKVALETKLPRKCIVIATSNGVDKLDVPLLQRFKRYTFGSGEKFIAASRKRLGEIWRAECSEFALPDSAKDWGVLPDGSFSMRVALDSMQDYLAALEIVG